MRQVLPPLLGLLLVRCPFAAELQLHPLLSDGAVIQAGVPQPVRGRGRPGSTVTVIRGAEVRTLTVPAEGTWSLELPALEAGTACSITAKDDAGATVTAGNLLAGEVWLGSGQSNMVLTLKETDGADQEAAGADLPQIRWFWVPQKTSITPLDWTLGGSWQTVSPQKVKDMSAVAYYFAKHLQRSRKVPVGMVVAAWGGTPIKAWLSEASFGGIPECVAELTERNRINAAFGPAWQPWVDRNTAWMEALAARDAGLAGHWESPTTSDADWPTMRLPAKWAEREASLKGLVGSVWFRRAVAMPASWKGHDLCLFLAQVNDYVEVWVDGKRVYQDGPTQRGIVGSWRRIRVPGDAFQAGAENVIAVRVVCQRGDGGIHSGWPFQVAPWDPIPGVQTGITVFKDTDWRWRIGSRCDGDATVAKPPLDEPQLLDGPVHPCVLANGMISAIDWFPIHGGIWYQGESDVGSKRSYLTLLTALVREWRTRWHDPQLPVLVVQLPQNGAPRPLQAVSGWALLREAQRGILALPRTGLAVTIDTAADGNLHPRLKQPIGERLSLLARRIAYGEDLPASGPVFAGAKADGARMRLSFTEAAGLHGAADGSVAGFLIAGSDKSFVAAKARIEGDGVVVWNDAVTAPVAVRYAWGDNPANDLRDGQGLPASPFRTDDW